MPIIWVMGNPITILVNARLDLWRSVFGVVGGIQDALHFEDEKNVMGRV